MNDHISVIAEMLSKTEMRFGSNWVKVRLYERLNDCELDQSEQKRRSAQ